MLIHREAKTQFSTDARVYVVSGCLCMRGQHKVCWAILHVCVCPCRRLQMYVCERNEKRKERKLDFHTAVMPRSVSGSRPLGHLTSLFINLLPQRKDACCSLSLILLFPLCHISPLLPLPSPCRSPLFFLLQPEPSLTLMKRHVLHNSLSPTNTRDGA